MNYANFISNRFYSAFEQAKASSEIFDIFCYEINYTIPVYTKDFKMAVKEVCNQHAWRFRGILHAGTTDFCEFGSYPFEYKPHLKANELDPENCE